MTNNPSPTSSTDIRRVGPMTNERVWIASYVASKYAGVLSRGLHFRSIHDSEEMARSMSRDPQAIDFTVTEYVRSDLITAPKADAGDEEKEIVKRPIAIEIYEPMISEDIKSYYEEAQADAYIDSQDARVAELEKEAERYLTQAHNVEGNVVFLQRCLEAAESSNRQLKVAVMCPVCVGNPLTDSPCICGGTNDVQVAYTNVLLELDKSETSNRVKDEEIAILRRALEL